MTVSKYEREILGLAMDLVNRVHYGKPGDTHAFLLKLSPQVTRSVLLVLAEMVPQEQTPGTLRQWKTGPKQVRMPLQARISGYDEACGSQAAYVRHVTYDEPIDEACEIAHQRYLFTHPIRRAA